MKTNILLILSIIAIGISFNSYADIPIPKIKPNYHYLTSEQQKEVDCLAGTIYFEARGESESGQIAVGLATINRTYSSHFPDSVCRVIKERKNGICQYNWYCNHKQKKIFYAMNHENDNTAYNDTLKLATYIYINRQYINDLTKNAVFFHRTSVNPRWKNVIRTTTIGKHVFYASRIPEINSKNI